MAVAGLPARRRRPASVSQQDVLADFATHVHSFVDVAALRPLKVVADTANGMGGLVAPAVFAGLPFDVEMLYGELDGTFPNHPADPIQPENLRRPAGAGHELRRRRRARLRRRRRPGVPRRRRGALVSGSLTTAMVAKVMLDKFPGSTILHNLICSKAVPEVIRENGGTPVRTRVGPLPDQEGHGRDRRRLRGRALGPLLLPRQLPGRLRHHRRARRPRGAVQGRGAALRVPQAVRALRRLRRDQHPGGRPGRGDGGGRRPRTRTPSRTASTA